MRRTIVVASLAIGGMISAFWLVVMSDGESRAASGFSLNEAYQAAAPGDTITIPAGTYSSQVIQSKTTARGGSCSVEDTSECVRFVVGGDVRVEGVIEIRGSGIWLDGDNQLDVQGYTDTEANSNTDYPDHVVVQNLHTTSFGVFNSDSVTFKNVDVGPSSVGTPTGCGTVPGPGIENKIGFGGDVSVVPTNVVLDGVHVHDQNATNRAWRESNDCHFGGLFLVTVDGLVIRNSVFERNVIYSIQVQNFAGPKAKNVMIQGNSWSCGVNWTYDGGGCVQDPIQFDYDPGTEFTIEDNNFSNGPGGGWGCYVGTCGGLTGLKVSGNRDFSVSPDAPPLPNPRSLPLTVVSQTASTITLGWVAVPGAGYRFSRDDRIVSHTWDQTRATVKFAKGTSYQVEALGVIASGRFP